MSLRNLLNQRQAFLLPVLLTILFACVGVTVYPYLRREPRYKGPATAFYYDLGNGQLFDGPIDQPPPIKPPSGATQSDGSPGGVRAYVFSCGECKDPLSRFVGYLLTQMSAETSESTDSAIARLPRPYLPAPAFSPQRSLGLPLESDGSGRILVADPQGAVAWLDADSPEAEALMRKVVARCGEGKVPMECFPVASSQKVE